MKRMIYKELASVYDEPVEVFWIAGLHRCARNAWWIRTVFRGRESQTLSWHHLPIGMWPLLNLGVEFDRGLFKTQGVFGELGEVVIDDMARFDVITSAQVPSMLYPLPEGKAGTQRLLRYRTSQGEVIVPVVELIRVLFVHNRSLALALMRPAGLEQLYYPDVAGPRSHALLRFTHQMPGSGVGRQFAAEFAWIVFDRDARRSWDSVRRLSEGKPYVLFQPPGIRHSTWSFRGVRHGERWFVLELRSISGRHLPFEELEYTHPEFRRVMRSFRRDSVEGVRTGLHDPGKTRADPGPEFEVADGESGSASYRNPLAIGVGTKQLAFENRVVLRKLAMVIEKPAVESVKIDVAKPNADVKKKACRSIRVTTMERAGKAALPPLDFRMLAPASVAVMGDLDALDEAVRHMRDMLPEVSFEMSLVQLRPGRAVSTADGKPRPAMVVLIHDGLHPPIALLDVERTGIEALSLMVMHFLTNVDIDRVEAAAKRMLDGLVDAGGHWPAEVERALSPLCKCERIPRLLVPREKLDQLGRYWGIKLAEKLGLVGMLEVR
jgi:hypothetical protein